MLETRSLGPLEVYQSTRPWKCKNYDSLCMKTVREFICIERLNAGTGNLGPLEVY